MIDTLVVDDDFRVAEIHRDFVDRVKGFRTVGVAHSGWEALDLTKRLAPDLCLLDIYLPDMSGLEVARMLKERPGRADVIVITAARDAETVRSSVQHGALHFLVKPFSFATLREKLEAYAAWRARLDGVEVVDQDTVDELFGTMRSQHSGRLPKGLSHSTLELVEQTLREHRDDLSAEEVARAAGVSRVTARRYLEYLTEVGRAELRLRYGRAGRPEHRFAPAGKSA